jgi:hypothetical protein
MAIHDRFVHTHKLASRSTDTRDGLADDGHAPERFSTGTTVQASTAVVDTLYLQEPGDTSAISVADINQGQLGDCFLLSPIGELALFHPSSIMNMIHANANGTETVTLYTASNGELPSFGTTSFSPDYITVTNSFPSDSVNNASYQDVAGNQKEIWPQVLEKAFATLDGGYGAIANGGSPVIATEELTGQPATWMSPAALTLGALVSDLSAGDLITMDTSSNTGLPFNLVSNHAYMTEGVTTQGGVAMVQLINPWGFNEPAAIPLTQLSQGIIEVDIGHIG